MYLDREMAGEGIMLRERVECVFVVCVREKESESESERNKEREE